MIFYTVLEIQMLEGDTKATLATAYDNYDDALSAYYLILSAAAHNGIPYHAAYLIDSKRGVRKSEIFDRTAVTADGESNA